MPNWSHDELSPCTFSGYRRLLRRTNHAESFFYFKNIFQKFSLTGWWEWPEAPNEWGIVTLRMSGAVNTDVKTHAIRAVLRWGGGFFIREEMGKKKKKKPLQRRYGRTNTPWRKRNERKEGRDGEGRGEKNYQQIFEDGRRQGSECVRMKCRR